jgi:hypothetical protein
VGGSAWARLYETDRCRSQAHVPRLSLQFRHHQPVGRDFRSLGFFHPGFAKPTEECDKLNTRSSPTAVNNEWVSPCLEMKTLSIWSEAVRPMAYRLSVIGGVDAVRADRVFHFRTWELPRGDRVRRIICFE